MPSFSALKNDVREWYLNNPNGSLLDAAMQFNVPYETVRDWSRNEGWSNARDMANVSIDNDVKEEASVIRGVIYSKITNENLNAKDLSELVKAWRSMAAMETLNVNPEDGSIDREELDRLLDETD